MLRSRLYILAIVVIAVLWGAGVAVPTMDSAITAVTVSTRLTAEEAECIVGGQASCWDEGKAATEECVSDNLVVGDPKSGQVALDCFVVGGYTIIACSLTWLWGLFF